MSHSSGSSKYTICLTTATIYYRYRKVWREWPARSPHAFISTYAHKPWKCNCASLNIVKPSKSTKHLWVLDPRAGGQPLRCLYPELGRRGRWVQICFHPWHVVTSPPGIHEHLPPRPRPSVCMYNRRRKIAEGRVHLCWARQRTGRCRREREIAAGCCCCLAPTWTPSVSTHGRTYIYTSCRSPFSGRAVTRTAKGQQ